MSGASYRRLVLPASYRANNKFATQKFYLHLQECPQACFLRCLSRQDLLTAQNPNMDMLWVYNCEQDQQCLARCASR